MPTLSLGTSADTGWSQRLFHMPPAHYPLFQAPITVVRLFHDYLIEKQIRLDNPVGKGFLKVMR